MTSPMNASDEQKNPFMFEDMYPGKDIGDYNSEEAYEMGVSAGMDSQQAHYQPQAAGDAELEYEGRLIEVRYFNTDAELMAALKADGIEPKYDSIAYCDTYGPGKPSWGRLYLLDDGNLDSLIHECIHLASGIFASKGITSLGLTYGDADPNEESFAGLVGNLVGLLTERPHPND